MSAAADTNATLPERHIWLVRLLEWIRHGPAVADGATPLNPLLRGHTLAVADTLDAAAKLSERYITDRFLPDKAIDVIDEAGARERLATQVPPPEVAKLKDDLEQISRDKENAVRDQNFERAAAHWAALAEACGARGLIPFLDLAYQGFGDGLEQDAAATRKIAAAFPEVLIAASCSKNFGIYRERTGILIGLGSGEGKAVLQGNLNFLNRQNYSFPPDHGARLVTMILEDDDLRADWMAELEEVRLNMLSLRQSLADELRKATNSDRFDFVATHRGMFSRLGLTEAQVNTLREDHAIYMVGDSRINIAGLNARTVPILAAAIAQVAG